MTDLKAAIVGGGRVGQSLARALLQCGYRVTVASARGSSEEDVARLRSAVADADTIVITVPDFAIADVAGLLSGAGVHGGQVVLHTSGAVGSGALTVLSERGVTTGSLHPLMTFMDVDGQPDLFAGTPAIVEGSDQQGREAARQLATLLGMTPIVEIDGNQKPGYHAAAVFASNYLVVLTGIAERLAHQAGIAEARGLFGPLMAQTLKNLETHDPKRVLTGPITRRDEATVKAHLEVLNDELAELYRLLAEEASKLN